MKDFFNSNFGFLVRFLFFLPIGLCAFFIGPLLANILYDIATARESSEFVFFPRFWEYVRSVLSCGFGGFSAVYAGSYVIPKYKIGAAILLCIIVCSVILALCLSVISLDLLFFDGRLQGWMFIGAMGSVIIGAGIATFHVYESQGA